MSFDDLVRRAGKLLAESNTALSLATESGEIHWGIMDNRDLSSKDANIFPIPFHRSLMGVSKGLEDLIVLMTTVRHGEENTASMLFSCTQALSRPQTRVSMVDDKIVAIGFRDQERGYSTYLDSSKFLNDPITTFNSYARDVLMAYSDGDSLFGGTVARDHFLMVALSALLNSRTFRKEGLEAASDEMVRALRQHLDNLQKLYDIDVERIVKGYASILDGIQQQVIEMFPTYSHLRNDHRRLVFSLSEKAKGKFRVPKGYTEGHGNMYEREAYKIRRKIISRHTKDIKLLERMASGQIPWSDLLPDIVDLINAEHEEPIDKYVIVEPSETGKGYVEAKYVKVNIPDVIGQQENVKRLGTLLYAFGEGRRIPNTVLYGRAGMGKTMSVRAVADIHPNLRTILLSYRHINRLGELISETQKLPYQVVAYVDDMHFPSGFDFEHFKTKTCGIKDDWPSNFAIVVSVNPEAFGEYLPDSVKSRFGVILDYNKKLDEPHWRKVFGVAARQYGMEDKIDELWNGFFSNKNPTETYFEKELDGRQIRDYVIEQKAMTGLNLPVELR